MDTSALVREARAALRILEQELAKLEYLATSNLPQVAHLQEQIREHAQRLAGGLVALSKARFEAKGAYLPEVRLKLILAPSKG